MKAKHDDDCDDSNNGQLCNIKLMLGHPTIAKQFWMTFD